MAGLDDAGEAAHRANDGERGWARRLVDIEDSGCHASRVIRWRASVSTLASASFSGSATSRPAARRWPPPPNFSASSGASTRARLRVLALVSPGPGSFERVG